MIIHLAAEKTEENTFLHLFSASKQKKVFVLFSMSMLMYFPLCAATIFGQNQKLEPLSPEKKSMWKREMNCLLAVCDYMVEFFPSLQTLPNGTSVEVKIFVVSHPNSLLGIVFLACFWHNLSVLFRWWQVDPDQISISTFQLCKSSTQCSR